MNELKRLFKKINRSIIARGFKETTLIILNDLLFSFRYKVSVKESVPLDFLDISSPNRVNGNPYEGASYYYVKKALRSLPVDLSTSALIEYGSGKGNVIIMSSEFGFKQILGIEFAKDLAIQSERNIETKIGEKTKSKIKMICCDATFYEIPAEYNVFFFFNPFNSIVFEKILINIDQSLTSKKRDIYLVYVNPTINTDLFIKYKYNIIFNHSSKEKPEILIFSK